MNKQLLRAAALPLLALIAPAAAPAQKADRTERLRDAALKGDEVAYDIVEGLTTEIGPRLAGTPQEARAREWGVRKLKSLGFSNVRIETYQMPVWVRGEERAEIVAPFPQKLAVTALGNSGATPATGLDAEVVGFDSLADLEAAPAAAVRGKIVFVSHGMTATQDGSQYGYYGAARRTGPSVASRKGAAAIVIRSIGTDHHRNPHTGVQIWSEGVSPIPAGALSVPDAEQLQRILKRGKRVTMRLTLTPRNIGMQEGGNVVAEVPGTDPKAGIVLIGGHLDSWDLGTGAIDNAAGVAITAAAAKRIMDAGRPRRTIRVVWFGAEEVGGNGDQAYRAAHGKEKVVFVSESDFGADRVWRMDPGFAPVNAALADRVAAALAPLGIARSTQAASGGADLGEWVQTGVAAIDLQQDGTRYFDYHHTPDDTLDKVDPEQLRQNVAAWTAMLSVVANAPEEIVPAKPGAPAR
ncbi:M20/M25/M40 family metallo-hydrolase [Sphingosinicella sp. BN140058]|uniref:M20/M25/M40 family metallo-hydrolase n=1 Tax=Sphingosinicella sp. BN140058 TaxID=1892855 RepID=UPI001010F680|nr:M20/M25/M40 family metallo-hydrolase [Sphingosinicella sp. BN140058]QAY79294.1 peptidase M28 family protein [Sphingosinicella sp. BN140058]